MWEDEQSYEGEEHVDDDVYSETEVEELLESDEIMEREEAFMRGYDQDIGKVSLASDEEKHCPQCGYEVDFDDKICPVCGTTIRAAAEEA